VRARIAKEVPADALASLAAQVNQATAEGSRREALTK